MLAAVLVLKGRGSGVAVQRVLFRGCGSNLPSIACCKGCCDCDNFEQVDKQSAHFLKSHCKRRKNAAAIANMQTLFIHKLNVIDAPEDDMVSGHCKTRGPEIVAHNSSLVIDCIRICMYLQKSCYEFKKHAIIVTQ